jgi:hypothetical protein
MSPGLRNQGEAGVHGFRLSRLRALGRDDKSRGHTLATSQAIAFILVATISALAAPIFWRLPPDASAELADRTPAPTEASDQRVG